MLYKEKIKTSLLRFYNLATYCNVYPTRETVELVKQKLQSEKIDFCVFSVDGIKQQIGLASLKYSFLGSI